MKSKTTIKKKEKPDFFDFSFLSGYCDSNTGPSGPKPDALANCATPRVPSNGIAKIHHFLKLAKYFLTFCRIFTIHIASVIFFLLTLEVEVDEAESLAYATEMSQNQTGHDYR